MRIDRFVMVDGPIGERGYALRVEGGGEWMEVLSVYHHHAGATEWAVEALTRLVMDPNGEPLCAFEREAREAIIRNGGFAVVQTGNPADLAFLAKDNCGKIMIIVRGCVPHTWS